MRHHFRQPIGTEQQAIAGFDSKRVRLDFHAFFRAADDVGDDVTQTMAGDLVLTEFALAHEFFHERVIAGELVQVAPPPDVRSAVANVHDAEVFTEEVGDRQGSAHPCQLGALGRFLDNARVRFAKRLLKLRKHTTRFRSIRREEPLQRVQGEVLDGDDRERARRFTG